MQSANKQKAKQARKERRRGRVRMRVQGTAQRPRLSVSRSLTTTRVQLIDDVAGATLLAVSTRELKERGEVKAGEVTYTAKVADAYRAGELLGKQAKEKGITSAVFDKGPNKYHGRVRAVAEGARSSGLVF